MAITTKDLLHPPQRPGALRFPVVFPFFYELTIANGIESAKNFPEQQNLEMVAFILESDGELTLGGNLFRLLAGSQRMLLNGSFEMVVPQGYVYPIDFVPNIEYKNASGSDRELTFYGWLTRGI